MSKPRRFLWRVLVVTAFVPLANAMEPPGNAVAIEPRLLANASYSFNDEPYFLNFFPKEYWTPDDSEFKSAKKHLLKYLDANRYEDVLKEFEVGSQQYVGLKKGPIKFLYIVNAHPDVFKKITDDNLWQHKLFGCGELNAHSWAALYDADKNNIVGIYFCSAGISHGDWPKMLGEQNVTDWFKLPK